MATVYTDLTQVTKANIKAVPGVVLSAFITNANASLRYFQLFNSTATPAGGDVPIFSFPIPAGTAAAPGTVILDSVFFARTGKYFSTGIGWAISTTLATFTDSATASDHVAVINYD